MINPKRKLTRAVAFAMLFCFTSLTGAQPLYAIPPNTQLPTPGNLGVIGTVDDPVYSPGNTMTINQQTQTAVNRWENFSIGADASVIFTGPQNLPNGFNSLNYVTGANAPISEIYGQLTAIGGNIFIANPAGVQIGNFAQINVGSLYVTNKDIGQAIKDGELKIDENTINVATKLQSVAATNAELMSLGAIVNAKKVTFDGGRIVIDTDRIYADNADGELQPVDDASLKGMLNIITTDKDNVVLGSSERAGIFNGFSINGGNDKLEKGYTWIHDLAELQAMDKNKSGWYALRNSIDANATAGTGFDSIGTDADRFTGRFDGLGYSIFGLNIDKDATENIGLFGYAQNATIRNFTLNSSEIKGDANTGAVVGHADGGKIENVTNTGNVTGGDGTGGIVGKAENNVAMSGLINIGKVVGKTDTGGVVGSMSSGTLGGDTYNLGSVTGTSSVGGIAGSVTDATIGNEVTQDNPDTFQIFNQLNVTGDYNVGGIAGTLSGSTITNAANHGNVTAEGSTKDNYSYHTAEQNTKYLDGATLKDDVATIEVKAANAGGIAGETKDNATISNVLNDGDVTSVREDSDNHYKAGNVGGIVGRAEDTTITNAENKENTVAGAHNVGGVAGFLSGTSTVDTGLNNGGDITATGARKYNVAADDKDGYAKERVRPIKMQDGQVVIDEIFNVGNIGGVVGYLFGDKANIRNSGNRGTVHSETIQPDTEPDNILETAKAANVGGVVGKIDSPTSGTLETLKGDPSSATVSGSYSTGDVQGFTGVGGVVGMMYNGSITGAYNLGTVQSTRKATSNSREPLNMGGVIGDTTEEASARAVIYDVYNAGQIGDEDYEYYGRHVGGVVGRLSGELEKAYNTGDIYNGYSVTGGVVGWWYRGNIKDVFNTGNVTAVNNNIQTGSYVGGIVGALDGSEARSLSYAYNLGTIRSFKPSTNTSYGNFVSGIIGAVEQVTQKIDINNVYTSNNIYAAKQVLQGQYQDDDQAKIKAIWNAGLWGADDAGSKITVGDAYYVKLYDGFFQDLDLNTGVEDIEKTAFDKHESYGGFFSDSNNGWRIYNGTTPILNAFLPNAEQYFGDLNDEELLGLGIAYDGIQYGTAANPLLTIITAAKKDDGTYKDVELNWNDLGSSGNASLAVYGGGLTLNEFGTGAGYYRGTLYADGALTVNGADGTTFNLGSSANLYGTNVEIDANGDATIYGNVTSTNGGISIKGDDVEIIGKLAASKAGDEAVSVKNIAKQMPTGMTGPVDGLKDPKAALPTVSDAYAYKANDGQSPTNDGDVSVNASGAAEVLYGNLSTGQVVSGGSFSVSGGESVYVDSDLHIGKDLTLNSDGEIVLDLSNMGVISKENLHQNFLDHFKTDGNNIKVTGGDADGFILALDMWDAQSGSFKFDKYDVTDDDVDAWSNGTIKHKLTDDLGELNISINGKEAPDAKNYTHVWVNDANQLKGIQEYAEKQLGHTDILSYNFALKGNIDASALTGYEEIGDSDKAYSGTFDGRDFRIIGLNTNASSEQDASSGIFGTLAGTVKDLRVYASKFFGGENAGVIAANNKGTITGVTTFGNRVEAENAGGIAGTNAGKIESSAASDSVITNGGTAGGIAGTNTGTIGAEEGTFVTAESAVTSGANGATAIGGVVGKNEGEVNLANSLGVTNGANVDKNVGGIAGVNSGEMYSLYNESVVSGKNNVGGVAGDNSGTMTNAVNATRVTGTGTNTGGLVGNNSGTVDSGRNAGVITGKTSVGGMVGSNENGGILQNLSNAIVAAITGKNYVGGIAGSNAGSITSSNNLTNEGTISGTQFVGGIAGENKGKIENVLNETLVLKTGNDVDARYFGGIAGTNSGKITNATNNSNVRADGATFVGGIAGKNTDTGKLTGSLVNNGDVTGLSNVGGLAGENNNGELLKGGADNPLRVTNNGTITATTGGAGGIFHTNTGDIEYAVLTNNGTIIAKGENANTGGLFGSNSGNIANSTLANSGEVNGGANTGGLIGENSGNASFSSLVNTGKVSGGDNTGGLIGLNTGTLTGGRGTGENGMTLYKYQIYNNGAVSGTDNVGGLIGHNDKGGALYAGYNTGTVNGDDSVGGIVGRNDGSVSSVFNTIMTGLNEDGTTKYGAVTGKTNVGGLVGFNAGTLTDGYNTTGVTGGGNAAGTNTGVISRVYATNTTGRLINNNSGTASNVYTFAAGDGSARFVSEAERMFSRFYGGFGFGSTWKNYDGWSTPMLKVFLTQAGYSADTELVQTGYPMSLPIKGYVVAGDNLIAYDNANALLVALANTELGDDYLAFYSAQIAASGEGALFNPNNLGYDIDVRYSIVPLFEHNAGYLHWLHRGGDRERNFRERKAEIYFHEGGMVHEEAL